MKRKFFTLLLCVIFGSTTVFAQTETIYPTNIKKEYPKHEIGLSYGIEPIITTLFSFGKSNYDYEDVYPYYENQPCRLGSFNTQYRLYFNPIHSLNFNFSWAVYEHTLKVRQSGIYKNSNVHHLTFQVGYSVYYLRKNIVSLYSSIYAGVTLSSLGKVAINQPNVDNLQYGQNNICLFHQAFHLTILGLQLGKNNAANFELGFGTQGVLKVGYSCKF